MDEDDNPLAGAYITVAGREQFVVRSTVRGEYWRLLLPGSYTLKVCLAAHPVTYYYDSAKRHTNPSF